DLVVIAPRTDLREARWLLQGARAAAREERKHAALVLPAARLDLLLGESHPGDLRRRVDDRRDHVVVHLAETPGDEVGDHHALLLAGRFGDVNYNQNPSVIY